MYILIFEDCLVTKQEAITEEDLKSSEVGILSIINIEDPNNPLMHISEKRWEPLYTIDEIQEESN